MDPVRFLASMVVLYLDMDTDLLVIKTRDEVDGLEELQEGDREPLGSRETVREALASALPGLAWADDSTGIWHNAGVFILEIRLPAEADPVPSMELRVRLDPARKTAGWSLPNEGELEEVLIALCDPQGWTLFYEATRTRFRFVDEAGFDVTRFLTPGQLLEN